MGIIRTANRDDLREDRGYVGRFYHWKNETGFISVTNALKNGVPSPYLNLWYSKVVAEHADEHWDALTVARSEVDVGEFVRHLKAQPNIARDAAGDLGSTVHEYCEDIMLGVPLPLDMDAKVAQRVRQFLSFIDTVEPRIVAVEGVCFNREYGYAGAFDIIADIPNYGRYIIDIKTGKGVYGTAALQQTAYRHAEFIAVGDEEVPMIDVDGAMILHLTPRMWKLIPVVTDGSAWNAFRAALHTAKWLTEEGNGTESSAILDPIAKGKG